MTGRPPKKRKAKLGRPPVESPRSIVRATKFTREEDEACQEAARAEGKTLSSWLRDAALLRAAAHGT